MERQVCVDVTVGTVMVVCIAILQTLAPLVLAVNLVSMEEYTTGLCLRVNAYVHKGTKAHIVRLQKIVL